MEYNKEINDLKESVNNKNLDLAKLQERLKTLEEDKENYQKELAELGIDNIEDLKKEIESLTEEIEAGINKCKSQMK